MSKNRKGKKKQHKYACNTKTLESRLLLGCLAQKSKSDKNGDMTWIFSCAIEMKPKWVGFTGKNLSQTVE